TSAVGPFVERYADAGTESGVFGIVAGRAAETQPGPFFVVGELALNAGARVDAILETIPPASDARRGARGGHSRDLRDWETGCARVALDETLLRGVFESTSVGVDDARVELG